MIVVFLDVVVVPCFVFVGLVVVSMPQAFPLTRRHCCWWLGTWDIGQQCVDMVVVLVVAPSVWLLYGCVVVVVVIVIVVGGWGRWAAVR